MDNLIEKTCSNCKYYVEHYIKSGYKFKPIMSGHCGNINHRVGRKLSLCDYWRHEKYKHEERKTTIINELIKMAANINDIKTFLLHDIDQTD